MNVVHEVKCDGCSLELGRNEIFRFTSRPFASHPRALCPACVVEKEGRVYLTLACFFTIMVLVGALLVVVLPSLSIGSWLLNIAALQFFVLISTILHELGHACSSWLVGFRVFAIEIGHGRLIADCVFRKLRWQFRAILFGGVTYVSPRNVRYFKLRESLVVLGGPLMNVLLAVICVFALPIDDSIQAGSFKGFSPAMVFLLSNAALLVYSLWPHRFDSPYGKIPNDALKLWETWRRSKAQVEQIPAYSFFLEAQECQRQGDHSSAKKWIEDGLKAYPDDLGLNYSQASNLTDLRLYKEARTVYLNMLEKYGRSEELRFIVLNSIAYVNILSGDAHLLDEADSYSRLAYEKYPSNLYYKGTRGAVLIELGQSEEGLKLLCQVLPKHYDRQSQALDACFIAIAQARLGKLKESRDFFTMARRLDPNCFLLERENRANFTGVTS